MPDHAATAAAYLRQAAEALNDGTAGVTPAEAARMRLAIAREYVRLAAISNGLPPGCACHDDVPGPGRIGT